MKRLLAIPVALSLAFGISSACFAESALTYVGTVVYMSEYERTLDEVVAEAVESAKAEMEQRNGNIPTAGINVSPVAPGNRSIGIKDVIKGTR